MAKKSISAWKQIYKQAIEYMGIKTKPRWSLDKLKAEWLKIRKEQRQEGIELPNVQTVSRQYEYDYQATPRDEEMNTLPPDEPLELGKERVDKFIEDVTSIYQDTKAYIASAPLNSKGNVKDPEFYFLQNAEPLLDQHYNEILSIIDSMRSQFSDEVVAEALSKDVELEYTQALVFMPPSDTEDNFEVTIEQLTGIMINLSSQYML